MRRLDTKQLAQARRKRYEEKYPDRVKASKQKYVDTHRKEINKKNSERIKKKWWTNPEKYREQQRKKYHSDIEANRKKQRDYYERNKEKQRNWARQYTRKLREEVIKGYGAECECCKESRYEFLALDHRNGGGNKERKAGKHTYSIYRDASKRKFPSDYRILCHNCNNALGFYGYCPHIQS